jgi:hypothetical protein
MEEKLKNVIKELNKTIETGYTYYVNSAIKELNNIINDKEASTSEKEKTDFEKITNSMAKTYEAKNHDYGNSFDQSLNEFGLVASVVRLGDKMNRIKSLIKKEAKVKDESIKDTLLDMANYAIMTIMWMNKK